MAGFPTWRGYPRLPYSQSMAPLTSGVALGCKERLNSHMHMWMIHGSWYTDCHSALKQPFPYYICHSTLIVLRVSIHCHCPRSQVYRLICQHARHSVGDADWQLSGLPAPHGNPWPGRPQKTPQVSPHFRVSDWGLHIVVTVTKQIKTQW